MEQNIVDFRFANLTHVRFVAFAIQWTTDFPSFFTRNMYACEKPDLKSLLSTGRIFNIVLFVLLRKFYTVQK